MIAICLIDTSVFYSLLIDRNQGTVAEFQMKIEAGEGIFLPMATIIEMGNHIGQMPNGDDRRQRAVEFVAQVKLAIDGDSPFTAIDFVESEKMLQWLDEFPDWAMQEKGLGDLSIKQDWERQCELNRGRRVYIWSVDGDLDGYDRGPVI